MHINKEVVLRAKKIKWSQLFKIVLGTFLVLFFGMSLYYANQMNSPAPKVGSASSYNAHYAAVLISTEKEFINSIQEGFDEEAKRLNVAIEYYPVDSIEKGISKIRMLMLSGVEGLIVQGINDEAYAKALEQVISEEIPIVMLYTDMLSIKRNAFVGVNPFDMGLQAAVLWAEGNGPSGDVVHLTQALSTRDDDPVAKLQVLGFMDSIEKRGYDNHVIVAKTQPTILSAEGILTELFLNEASPIGSVICTTLNDTLGVTQVIVDLNRVGKVKIIGTGFNEQIAEYIEKGVIYGTLFRDPQEMGINALRMIHDVQLSASKSGSLRDEYVDIPVVAITKENLETYRVFLKEAQ